MPFQEYECPISRIDFDFNDAEIVIYGESFYCSGCGGNHTAGVDVQMQTAIGLEDGDLEFRGLPKNNEEKMMWLEESYPHVTII